MTLGHFSPPPELKVWFALFDPSPQYLVFKYRPRSLIPHRFNGRVYNSHGSLHQGLTSLVLFHSSLRNPELPSHLSLTLSLSALQVAAIQNANKTPSPLLRCLSSRSYAGTAVQHGPRFTRVRFLVFYSDSGSAGTLQAITT